MPHTELNGKNGHECGIQVQQRHQSYLLLSPKNFVGALHMSGVRRQTSSMYQKKYPPSFSVMNNCIENCTSQDFCLVHIMCGKLLA